MFDTDRMYGASFKDAAMGAMAVVTKLQDYRSEVQVLALGLTFRQMCQHFNVRPVAALEAAGRIFEMESPVSPELRAMAEYIKHEIKA